MPMSASSRASRRGVILARVRANGRVWQVQRYWGLATFIIFLGTLIAIHKMRGNFSRVCLDKNLKSSKLENLSSVEGGKNQQHFFIHTKHHTLQN
jgi:hypothetical protein